MFRDCLKQYGLLLSWIIALASACITLYLSDVLQWPVCTLCWYQRVALYGLVVLLSIAAYRNEKVIVPYAKIFCILGFLFAMYHYAEQMIPGFAPIHLCTQGISCAETPVNYFGFITIPLMSAAMFGGLFCILICV